MGTTSRSALPVPVGCAVLALVLAVAEGVGGIQLVADTATGVALVLLPLAVVAVVLRRRRRLVLLVAVLSVLLAGFTALTAVRAHTASDRFEERVAAFPLPPGYRASPGDPSDADHDHEPEHVARAWDAPEDTDVCADLERAFREWAAAPVEASVRGAGCVLAVDGTAEKAEARAGPDDRRVVLEMWLEGSTLIHF